MSSSGPPTSGAPTLSQQTGAFQTFKAISSSSSAKSDWLTASIVIAKTAKVAGELAPFPYVKGVFGMVVGLLEAVEKLNKNREDLKELCENINEIVVVLQDQISLQGDTAAMKLKAQCEEFERILREMLQMVEKMQKRNQLKELFKASNVAGEIAGYERRIQGLLSLVQLITGFSTNMTMMHMSATTTDVRSKVHDIHAMLAPNMDQLRGSVNINNCLTPSRIFCGRLKILDKMHQYFAEDCEKQHIYVLHGLGGAGKTQIALKYIENSNHFTSTFFVDASRIETIEAGFKNIATLCSAGNSSQDGDKWLVTKHEEWLLLLDNADDPNLNLHKFLPQCKHGNIIITTRNPGLRVYGADSQVSDMEGEDAVTLLLRSGAVKEMTPHNKNIAARIVKALWYLPLAIVQAGAFIAKFGALDQYLELYAHNHDKLLREKPIQTHSDYAWTIYTTWQMSFDRLTPLAAMFLQLCSFLHREGISEDIFSRAIDYRFPTYGPGEEELQQPLEFLSHFQRHDGRWDSHLFLEVTNEITSYSLATFNLQKRTFSIHPLVHQWSRDILGDPESAYHIIHSVIGMSIKGIPEEELRLTSLRLLPHVDAIMQFRVNKFMAPDFRAHYGILYSWAGRHEEAKGLLIAVLERQIRVRGDDHLSTLQVMHLLAATYTDLGQFKEAEKLQLAVLKKRRAILGDNHPSTLFAMGNLANTYKALNHCQKAEELEVVVLKKRREILGEDHPDTLAAMGNLASTYGKLGQFQMAQEFEVVVVEKRRACLGYDHVDTLDAMYNLAITYRELGQFQKAEKLDIVVLEKRRALLGNNHPDTLDAMDNLAVTYSELSRFEEAEKLGVVVLKRRRATLGEDHLDTLNAMYNLTQTYRTRGLLHKAEELGVVVVEKRRAILGEDHLDTLSAIKNLAFTYYQLKSFEETERLYGFLFEKQKALLGGTHPETLKAMHNLASTCRKLGQFQRAEKLEVVVLRKRKAILGDDHPDTLDAMYNLATTYGRLGQFKMAERLAVVLVEKLRTNLGADHLHTLSAMNNLGVTYYKLNRFEEAEKLQIELVERQRVIVGHSHRHLVRNIKNLARTYHSLRKMKEVKELEGLLQNNSKDTTD